MNDINQNGGFVLDTLLSFIKEGLRIKALYDQFKSISLPIQEIVRDSFKPNGLYDIVTVIHALSISDTSDKIKIDKIIKRS